MGQSIKAIKREIGKHRRVIRRLLLLAEQEGWLDEQHEVPSEQQLQEVYHEQRSGEEGRRHPLDSHREQIEGWREEGYSFLVIHKLLEKRGVEYSETTVRRYIHRHFPKAVRPVMRRETTAGEVMEVDFGYLGLTWHTTTRSRRRTWVFSGRLRHSRRAYREVVFDQKQQTFFACHIHAFEWFGGVSEKVTPDNLKAAIIVASFEDPVVNRAYRELALLRVEWSEPFSGKLSVRLCQDCTASSTCSGGQRHEPEPMDSAGAGEQRVRVTAVAYELDRPYHNRRPRPDERRMTTYNTMGFAQGDIDDAASSCSRLT